MGRIGAAPLLQSSAAAAARQDATRWHGPAACGLRPAASGHGAGHALIRTGMHQCPVVLVQGGAKVKNI